MLITGGCFATREDVQILQNDLAWMQRAGPAGDSVHRTQLDHVIEQLAAVNDSLGAAERAEHPKSLGDVRQDLYAVGQQLIQIQELTGQSQSRLQELRGQLERRAPRRRAAGRRPSPTAGGAGQTTRPARPRPPDPGPNQLFELALDQLHRGSTSAARAGFQDLLRQYPNADMAPDAQFYLAET